MTHERFRFDGRNTVVTGGSRNLGREFFLALAEARADIAGAGVYLASDTASMVTAQVIVIAGGIELASAY